MAARLQAALALHQRGDLDGACAHYRDILRIAPTHFDACQLFATAALQKGDLRTAIDFFERALRLDAGHLGSLSNYGAALLGAGRFNDALTAFDRAIALSPAYPEAHNNRGEVLRALGRAQDALSAFVRAAQLRPGYADAMANVGAMLITLGRHADALNVLSETAHLRPNDPELWCNIASAALGLGRGDDAVNACRNALKLRPAHLLAFLILADALDALDRKDEALAASESALAADPSSRSARLALADRLRLRERDAEALAHYNILVRDPAPAFVALLGRADSLRNLRRYEDALQAYEQAGAADPGSPDAWFGRGSTLIDLGRAAEALEVLDAADALAPRRAEVLSSRGAALALLRRSDEALAAIDRALALKPDLTDAMSNRAAILLDQNRFEEAARQLESLRAASPGYDFLLGRLWHARLRVCDWSDHAELRDAVVQGLAEGRRVAMPFQAMLLPDAASQKRAAEVWSAFRHARSADTIPARPAGARPLRIGYFSADFRNHPLMSLIAGVLEAHDRTSIDPVGFGFGRPVRDEMRARAEAVFGGITELGALDDEAALRLAREASLDIAIDLTGHTGDGRPNLFARRLAPVQAGFLGYLGTMGIPAYDYLIADATVIPASLRQHYLEKIISMPDVYQPNDLHRPLPRPGLTRSDCGLPEDAFVFCSFNNASAENNLTREAVRLVLRPGDWFSPGASASRNTSTGKRWPTYFSIPFLATPTRRRLMHSGAACPF